MRRDNMKERTINDVIDCLLQTVQNVFDTRLYYLTQWSSTTGLALTGDEALTQPYYKITHTYATGSFTVQALTTTSTHLYEDYEYQTQQLSHLTLQDFDILHTSCIYDTARNQMISYCRPVLVEQEPEYEVLQQGTLTYYSKQNVHQQVEQVAYQGWQTERLKLLYEAMMSELGRSLTLREIDYIETTKEQWLTQKISLSAVSKKLRQAFVHYDNEARIQQTLDNLQHLQQQPLAYQRFLALQKQTFQ